MDNKREFLKIYIPKYKFALNYFLSLQKDRQTNKVRETTQESLRLISLEICVDNNRESVLKFLTQNTNKQGLFFKSYMKFLSLQEDRHELQTWVKKTIRLISQDISADNKKGILLKSITQNRN